MEFGVGQIAFRVINDNQVVIFSSGEVIFGIMAQIEKAIRSSSAGQVR